MVSRKWKHLICSGHFNKYYPIVWQWQRQQLANWCWTDDEKKIRGIPGHEADEWIFWIITRRVGTATVSGHWSLNLWLNRAAFGLETIDFRLILAHLLFAVFAGSMRTSKNGSLSLCFLLLLFSGRYVIHVIDKWQPINFHPKLNSHFHLLRGRVRLPDHHS